MTDDLQRKKMTKC